MMRDEEIQDALDRQARADAAHPSPDAADAAESRDAASRDSGDAGDWDDAAHPRDVEDAEDADRAAYAIVYAALAEDTGFALPPDFAESIAAAMMPEPARPSVFERVILPLLLLISAVIAVPATLPQLARASRSLFGAPESGLPAAAVAVLVLLLIAAADHFARRGGWAPRT